MLDEFEIFDALPNQDDPNFRHGFEVGRLYQQMAEFRYAINGTVHNDAVPAILAVSAACGKQVIATQSDETWSWIDITDAPPPEQ